MAEKKKVSPMALGMISKKLDEVHKLIKNLELTSEKKQVMFIRDLNNTYKNAKSWNQWKILLDDSKKTKMAVLSRQGYKIMDKKITDEIIVGTETLRLMLLSTDPESVELAKVTLNNIADKGMDISSAL